MLFILILLVLKGDCLIMLESKFQSKLIKELEELYPGSMVFKTDFLPGFPDLLILYKKRWAALECKKGAKSSRQPNQPYYVDLLNDMSFAAFICPENKQEVLDGLQNSLTPRRATRISKCE